MKSTTIVARIQAKEAATRAEGVAHVSIFGSRARGDASDLDFLIQLVPDCRFSLLNLSRVGLIIEEATGLQAQIILERSAPPDFKARIADDLAPVF